MPTKRSRVAHRAEVPADVRHAFTAGIGGDFTADEFREAWIEWGPTFLRQQAREDQHVCFAEQQFGRPWKTPPVPGINHVAAILAEHGPECLRAHHSAEGVAEAQRQLDAREKALRQSQKEDYP